MVVEVNGREIELNFYGPYDDIQCDSAVWLDTGEDIGDELVDQIMETHASDIETEVMEKAIGAAEAYYEGDR